MASMPSFLIRLRRWLSRCAQAVALFTSSSPSVRCTEESSPGADPWPPSPSQRWCLSAVRQPRSRRRAGARAQSKRPQGQTSSHLTLSLSGVSQLPIFHTVPPKRRQHTTPKLTLLPGRARFLAEPASWQSPLPGRARFLPDKIPA